MPFDPAWILCALVFVALAALTIAAWRAETRGELPPFEPDNSIVQGRGDWSRSEEERGEQ